MTPKIQTSSLALRSLSYYNKLFKRAFSDSLLFPKWEKFKTLDDIRLGEKKVTCVRDERERVEATVGHYLLSRGLSLTTPTLHIFVSFS